MIDSFLSDRGVQWDNEFWTHLCRLWGVNKMMSTAYHPETDGQTEIVNQEMERYLRAYCNYQQDDWDEWLIDAEAAANSAPSATTTISPFFATNGYEPRMTFDLQEVAPLPPQSTREKTERTRAEKFAKAAAERSRYCQEQISLAQSRMEEQANKSRKPSPNYQEGDFVWLNIKNVPTVRPSKKLDDKYARCKVIKRAGPNSYELELPLGMEKMHNKFHTSLLRPDAEDPLPRQYNEPQPAVQVEDEDTGEVVEEYEVEEILDSKMTAYGKLKYRVKWKGHPTDRKFYDASGFKHATEVVQSFHERYPEKPRSIATSKTYVEEKKKQREKVQHEAIQRSIEGERRRRSGRLASPK